VGGACGRPFSIGEAMNLQENIADAKKSLRRIKRAAPWLLTEYVELQNAKAALLDAQKRYELARTRWEEIGR
jgi:hypothetical protein